jgi:uncharacterized protein involved in type VI secretion and phage assembly
MPAGHFALARGACVRRDLNRPLVVGALWNGKDKPPDKNPGGNPRRVLKPRLGNKITFDDDKKQLIIEDGVGKGKITFDSQANKITIEAIDGDCFQTPVDDMTIVAQSIEMTANTNLEIHAGDAMQWGRQRHHQGLGHDAVRL